MPRLNAASPRNLRQKRRWILLPLALLALPVALKMLGVQAVNRAGTSPNSADASLRTRFYDAAPPTVSAQVLEAVAGLSTYGQPWRVIDSVAVGASAFETSAFQIRCEVPVLVFVDDLTVIIEAREGGSRVDVRSASRVGQGDFGENARHVRQILSALDKRCEPSHS